MTKARDLANLISQGNPLADGAISVSEITDLTASAAELNKLDGVTATTAELNQVVGATSALQTQLDNISVTSGSLTKTFTQNETADITLSQGITSAPVVSATKEVPQTGISSKNNWDVNSTASNYDFHNTAANVTLTPSTSTVGTAYGTSVQSVTNYDFPNMSATNLRDIHWKPDGTTFYLLHAGNIVDQYSCSTSWDVTTGTKVYSMNQSGGGNSLGLYIDPTGTYVFTTDFGQGTIYRWEMTTPWRIDTATYQSTYTASATYAYGSNIIDIWFSNSGMKMWTLDYSYARVRMYGLTTAYDPGTSNTRYTVTDNTVSGSGFMGFDFSDDGTKIFIGGHHSGHMIRQWSLSTAYDLSSTVTQTTLYTGMPSGASVQNVLGDVTFGNSGATMYLLTYGSGGSGDVSQVQLTSTTQALVLGSGSFASTDVGKRIVGNGGDVVLTATSGTFTTTGGSAFTDNSTIAAGSWQMFGLKSAGDVAGITMSGFSTTGTGFNSTPALASRTPSDNTFTSSSTGYLNTSLDCCVSKNGVYLYTINQGSNILIRQFTMSTPYDLSTATFTRSAYSGGVSSQSGNNSLSINNDGTKFYLTYNSGGTDYLRTWTASTAYDISTLGGTADGDIPPYSPPGVKGSSSAGGKFAWSADGTKAYFYPYNNHTGNTTVGGTSGSINNQSGVMYQYNVSSAFDWAGSNPSANAFIRVPFRGDNYASFAVTSDGKWLLNHQYNQRYMYVYPLTTPYDISTQVVASEVRIDTSPYNSSGTTVQGGIGMDHVNGILFNLSYTYKVVDANNYATEILQYVPTQQYNVAVTNSVGQIDSSAFIDINSMTAAQSAGTGTVHYAVSTDGRTTWSVAKGTDGVRPIVRNNSGTWQYNSQNTSTTTGYDFSTFAYANSTLSTTGYNLNDLAIKSDGTQIYWIDNNGRVRQQTLSTAYDLSTAGAMTFFDQTSQDNDPRDATFKPDGTKMYVLGDQNNSVFQYTLSTAWDVTTASYDSKSFAVSGQMSAPMSVQFKSDGLIMYIKENTNIFQYNLSTAWDVSTASYANKSFNNQSQDSDMLGMYVKPDATQLYAVGYSNDKIYVYNFGTAGDLATLTYSNNSYSLDSNNGVARGITLSSDGTKIYTADYSGQKIFQYNIGSTTPNFVTTPTWTNGTVNDELYTLQQALSVAANRMDKTQLDAIPDANHFPTGTSLDLMIALRMDTAASTLPTSDGVTLNYDAAALNEGAVLGTDYDFFFPSSTKVQIKSLAAQNLKVRVV